MRTAIAAHELLPKGLRLESLSIETGCVSVSMSFGASSSRCPLCGCGSSRAHSHYSRTTIPPPRKTGARFSLKPLTISLEPSSSASSLDKPCSNL